VSNLRAVSESVWAIKGLLACRWLGLLQSQLAIAKCAHTGNTCVWNGELNEGHADETFVSSNGCLGRWQMALSPSLFCGH
jgi:hypothetical protein